MIEIALKSYSFGLKVYFKEKIYILDAVVIVASIILIGVEEVIITDNAIFKAISKMIRIVFRFLRLFLVYRKLVMSKTIV